MLGGGQNKNRGQCFEVLESGLRGERSSNAIATEIIGSCGKEGVGERHKSDGRA